MWPLPLEAQNYRCEQRIVICRVVVVDVEQEAVGGMDGEGRVGWWDSLWSSEHSPAAQFVIAGFYNRIDLRVCLASR